MIQTLKDKFTNILNLVIIYSLPRWWKFRWRSWSITAKQRYSIFWKNGSRWGLDLKWKKKQKTRDKQRTKVKPMSLEALISQTIFKIILQPDPTTDPFTLMFYLGSYSKDFCWCKKHISNSIWGFQIVGLSQMSCMDPFVIACFFLSFIF